GTAKASGSAQSGGSAKTTGGEDDEAAGFRPAPSSLEHLDERRRKLMATIEDALPKLDVESLGVLVRNCQIALYNAEVEQTRKTVTEAQRAIEQGRPPGVEQRPEVDIEQISSQSFVIIFGPERVFFNRNELRELARLCWAADNETDGAKRLFRWFERERRDFIQDVGLDNPSDTGLKQLWSVIRGRYKPAS
ncbi:MAG: hypothetical protein ACOC0B_00725, partial [bacterium]